MLIGVEGFMGSGKTKLAKALALQLSAAHIQTDEFFFFRGDRAPYSSRIRKPALLAELKRVLSQGHTAVVDGICLRAVLGIRQHEVDKFIYVKRLSNSGTWHEEFHLEDFTSGPIPEYLRTEVTLSDFRYHERHTPHHRADLEVSWVEPLDPFT
jgi:hypothetical protein